MLCFIETFLNSRRLPITRGSYCQAAALVFPQARAPAVLSGAGGAEQGWMEAGLYFNLGDLPPEDFLAGSGLFPAPSTQTASSSKLSLVGDALAGKSKIVPCNVLALPGRGYFLHCVFGTHKYNFLYYTMIYILFIYCIAIKSQN